MSSDNFDPFLTPIPDSPSSMPFRDSDAFDLGHPLRSAGLAPGDGDAGITRPHLSRLTQDTASETSLDDEDGGQHGDTDDQEVIIHSVSRTFGFFFSLFIPYFLRSPLKTPCLVCHSDMGSRWLNCDESTSSGLQTQYICAMCCIYLCRRRPAHIRLRMRLSSHPLLRFNGFPCHNCRSFLPPERRQE